MKRINPLDLIGQVFDRLTVTQHLGIRSKNHYYLCSCSCGETTMVSRSHLNTGHTRSCGCFQRERILEATTKGPNAFLHREDGITELYVGTQKSGGKIVLLDTVDYPMVSADRWKINKSGVVYSIGLNDKLHRRFLPEANEIDHIDGDTLNNTRLNLRPATHSQNMMNTRKRANSSSQFKGVCWFKPIKKWAAQIKGDGTRRHLGYFSSEIDAAIAYDEAARELHAEFGRYNFPLEREQPALREAA